ncbi:MAG: hypothetical protein GXP29_12380 [Planctomycetes bacterium]|nr:hypothetical protein [Planctomycetota bacterium]
MDAQKRLLKIILWVVVAAGLCGISIVGFVGGNLADRVITTGIATAAACALLILASVLTEHRHTTVAGLLLMSTVVIEFLLATVVVWDLPDFLSNYRSWRVENAIESTLFLFPVSILLIAGALAARHTCIGQRACWWAIALIVTAFLLIESSEWAWPDQWGTGTYEYAGQTMFLHLGLAIICYAGGSRTAPKRWRYIGVVAAVAAWCLETASVWPWAWDGKIRAAYFGLCAIAVIIAHANLCTFATLKRKQAWALWVSVGTAALASLLVALTRASNVAFPFIETTVSGIRIDMIGAASGIVAAFSSLALCILSIMNKKSVLEAITDSIAQVELACPRCRNKQLLNPGESTCAQCELKIEVQFEEPRCTACAYLLVGLTGDVCPECGNAIVDQGALGTART